MVLAVSESVWVGGVELGGRKGKRGQNGVNKAGRVGTRWGTSRSGNSCRENKPACDRWNGSGSEE